MQAIPFFTRYILNHPTIVILRDEMAHGKVGGKFAFPILMAAAFHQFGNDFNELNGCRMSLIA